MDLKDSQAPLDDSSAMTGWRGSATVQGVVGDHAVAEVARHEGGAVHAHPLEGAADVHGGDGVQRARLERLKALVQYGAVAHASLVAGAALLWPWQLMSLPPTRQRNVFLFFINGDI